MLRAGKLLHLAVSLPATSATQRPRPRGAAPVHSDRGEVAASWRGSDYGCFPTTLNTRPALNKESRARQLTRQYWATPGVRSAGGPAASSYPPWSHQRKFRVTLVSGIDLVPRSGTRGTPDPHHGRTCSVTSPSGGQLPPSSPGGRELHLHAGASDQSLTRGTAGPTEKPGRAGGTAQSTPEPGRTSPTGVAALPAQGFHGRLTTTSTVRSRPMHGLFLPATVRPWPLGFCLPRRKRVRRPRASIPRGRGPSTPRVRGLRHVRNGQLRPAGKLWGSPTAVTPHPYPETECGARASGATPPLRRHVSRERTIPWGGRRQALRPIHRRRHRMDGLSVEVRPAGGGADPAASLRRQTRRANTLGKCGNATTGRTGGVSSVVARDPERARQPQAGSATRGQRTRDDIADVEAGPTSKCSQSGARKRSGSRFHVELKGTLVQPRFYPSHR